ncbi:hypothetical protein [Candidatus Roseilinea sp. NK_OTU-006]|jgi:hypothetical protein|uniref:hypothetical protein n=1 Tax=Candidatus Roseilinea sp. NK_OTU-006 TaxID=2704250 RepID=UPI001F0A57E0|nr:hypothetical protein [Candidatus Roseilinea sp. NK_OTU-006]
MTTNAMRPAGANRHAQLEQATALKALIGSASLALTLAGWGWLSYQQVAQTASAPPEPTAAEQAGAAPQQIVIVEPAAPARVAPLPTLAPLYTPGRVEAARPARTARAAQVTRPQVAAAPQPQPQPQLRMVTAPPRPVAVTRSSR